MRDYSGLWFVNGKISTKAARDRVWDSHHRKWTRLYNQKIKLEDAHRKKMDKLEEKFQALNKQRPFTPWVGHISEGAVEAFVESAKKEWEIRKKNRQ